MDTVAAFIASLEGCRLTAYRDATGVWTIGYGHTGSDVIEGTTWTKPMAESALVADIERFRHELATVHHGSPAITVPLSPEQDAAVMSFVFNLGVSAFYRSTLLDYINSRDWFHAVDEFLRWCHAGQPPVPLKGLKIRRLKEALMFMKGSPV